MRMQKRKFRIGQLATQLGVERFVIRFWEKEFKLRTYRSTGGQRFYTEEDLSLFFKIKELLYQKGFTISGARKYLTEQKAQPVEQTVRASRRTTMEDEMYDNIEQLQKQKEQLTMQIQVLQEKLIKLRELL